MQRTSKSGHRHTVYECRNHCGNFTLKNGSRCLQCYKKERLLYKEKNPNAYKQNKDTRTNHRKKYPCKNCGELIYEFNGLCKKCNDKGQHILGEIQQRAKNKRLADTKARLEKARIPAKVSICPSHESPNQRHFEMIDTSTNIGKCKYCGREKNYNKLQDKEFKEKIFGGIRK